MDRKKQLALWHQMPQPKPSWEEFKRMRGPDDLMRWTRHHAKKKANQEEGTRPV